MKSSKCLLAIDPPGYKSVRLGHVVPMVGLTYLYPGGWLFFTETPSGPTVLA